MLVLWSKTRYQHVVFAPTLQGLPGSKSSLRDKLIPPSIGSPDFYNGYKTPYYWFQTSVEKNHSLIFPQPRFLENSGRSPLQSPRFGVTTRRERRRYLDPHFFIMFHLNFGMGPNVEFFTAGFLLMVQKSGTLTSWYGLNIPWFIRALYIPGGCLGFFPSIVWPTPPKTGFLYIFIVTGWCSTSIIMGGRVTHGTLH